LLHAERSSALEADELIDQYRGLVKLTGSEIIPGGGARAVKPPSD
jgi:hypothetical protein